ncbi:MAG: hypothetical protein ISP10_02575 [Aeromicrobium sp.]|nr:hypothetical protein [Aeromicrobium sp.]
MYQESEIVSLLLALFLTPVMARSVRSIQMHGKAWFVAGYLSVVAGYVFTIVEGYWLYDLFNALEHLAYTVSGVWFAMGGLALLRRSRASRADA